MDGIFSIDTHIDLDTWLSDLVLPVRIDLDNGLDLGFIPPDISISPSYPLQLAWLISLLIPALYLWIPAWDLFDWYPDLIYTRMDLAACWLVDELRAGRYHPRLGEITWWRSLARGPVEPGENVEEVVARVCG